MHYTPVKTLVQDIDSNAVFLQKKVATPLSGSRHTGAYFRRALRDASRSANAMPALKIST